MTEYSTVHFLIQLLLPLQDEDGTQFSAKLYDLLAQELTEMFGGVTNYARAPAAGRWKGAQGTERDPAPLPAYDILGLGLIAKVVDPARLEKLLQMSSTVTVRSSATRFNFSTALIELHKSFPVCSIRQAACSQLIPCACAEAAMGGQAFWCIRGVRPPRDWHRVRVARKNQGPGCGCPRTWFVMGVPILNHSEDGSQNIS